MIPVKFEEANHSFGPPPSLDESQCRTIPAYVGDVKNNRSSVDGAAVIVTAWQPDAEEIEWIRKGNPIFLTTLGGQLATHFISTSFQSATNPA